MPELVAGIDAEVTAWVVDQIPDLRGEAMGPCTAIAVADGDRVMAGVVYHQYHEKWRTIQLTMAAVNPMWARREIIRGLLSYPFNQLNVWKCWALTATDNAHALKTFKHIGFTQEGVLADQFGPKRHAAFLRMKKPDFERLYER